MPGGSELISPHGDAVDWPLVVDGDHEAFERVFDRHAGLVHGFVRRRTSDEDVAEDIAAQVFLEAWRQRRKVALLDGSLRSWLLGVASNLVRRHWRSLDRSKRAVARLPVPKSVPDHADRIAEHLDAQQRLIDLRTELETMPRKQVEVLLLWAWEEMSHPEIADVLGIPVGTVRSRLSRARKRLSREEGTVADHRAFHEQESGGDGPPATNSERNPG